MPGLDAKLCKRARPLPELPALPRPARAFVAEPPQSTENSMQRSWLGRSKVKSVHNGNTIQSAKL